MRIYNASIGKFLSVDPLTKDYPWYTPYQFAGNKPIQFIDLDGAEENEPPSPGASSNESDSKPEVNAPKQAPLISVSFGNVPGNPDAKPLLGIKQLYGSTKLDFFNSHPYNADDKFAPDETDFDIKFAFRLKGNLLGLKFNGNQQLVTGVDKYKFRSKLGIYLEAPTSFKIGLAQRKVFFNNHKGMFATLNYGATFDSEWAHPKEADMGQVNYKPGPTLGGDKYNLIGLGATVFTKIDISFTGGLSFFAAGYVHHNQAFWIDTENGGLRAPSYGLFKGTVGVTWNFGQGKEKLE